MNDYAKFLAQKRIISKSAGFIFDALHGDLFDYQRDIVSWALKRGRAAIFAGCGLGKTFMQLQWAIAVQKETRLPVLILVPPMVAMQTVREADHWGFKKVKYCRSIEEAAGQRIVIINYEMLHHFEQYLWGGVVLDESSILKAQDGKTKQHLIDTFADCSYRLACTATPAPNDFMELGNHSEFLGIMPRTEMLASFFMHDGGETQKWRLKGHALDAYWAWVASWAVFLRSPSDLGYDVQGFDLPELRMHQHLVDCGLRPLKRGEGGFFPSDALSLMDRRQERRRTLAERVALGAELANSNRDPWVIWCDLNAEGAELTKKIAGAVEVCGSNTMKEKERSLLGFIDGSIRVLVSKPTVCGFGLNLQCCHNIAFVGLSDSYEQFYQATRRCWRFGQKHPVDCHIVIAKTEGPVLKNIQRKEANAEKMYLGMLKYMKMLNIANINGAKREETTYEPENEMEIPKWLQMS